MTEPIEVRRLCDEILSGAAESGAEEVHVEPTDAEVRVRYRFEGQLYVTMTPHRELRKSIVRHFKSLAGMDQEETRLPQDGLANLRIAGKPFMFRCSTISTIGGERVLMSLRPPVVQPARTLGTLGLPDRERLALEEMLRAGPGMFLVGGPTFSGKTITLYALLMELDRERLHVVTAEDPVQRWVHGVTQSQMDFRAGFTFAGALRGFLEQQADAILLQELRDREVADLVHRAVEKGSLVLTMMHVEDAPSGVARLLDMGLAPARVASSLRLVLGQRLVRRLCGECKRPWTPTEADLAAAGIHEPAQQLFRPAGCERCRHSGYDGHQLIVEALPILPEMVAAIASNHPTRELYALQTSLGWPTLRQAGLTKAVEGVTSVEEVLLRTPGPRPPV